jgi:aminoglycoside phosphotransferase (APT) family kinase protein
VLSAPDDVTTTDLAAALSRHWGVAVASVTYRPVGAGSYHWAVADPTGGGWFVTADDLEVKRRSQADSLDDAYSRLRRALDAAGALRASGAHFVVAPLPTARGEPLIRLTDRYAVAVYPMIEGESFAWAAVPGHAQRDAQLPMLVAVHRAPAEIARRAPGDDFTVPHRDALDAALDGVTVSTCDPDAERATDLLTGNAEAVGRLLERYDLLAAGADRGRAVLTHGEPHPGNIMRTPSGWRLIDWDTAMTAPPERDLWLLGGDFTGYTEATGVAVRPELLEMYRLRWQIADIAVVADRFRRPHNGTADDDEEWTILESTVRGISL